MLIFPLQRQQTFQLSPSSWLAWHYQGKKEAISEKLSHEQVKRLTDKKVKKYQKRYEAYCMWGEKH